MDPVQELSYPNLCAGGLFVFFYFLCLVGYLFQGMILPKIHSIPLLKKAECTGMSHEMTHWNLSLPTVSWVILGIPGDGSGPWILHLKHGDGVHYVVAKKLFSFL